MQKKRKGKRVALCEVDLAAKQRKVAGIDATTEGRREGGGVAGVSAAPARPEKKEKKREGRSGEGQICLLSQSPGKKKKKIGHSPPSSHW